MDTYINLITFGTPEFDEALRLREKILRKPLNMTFREEDIAKEFDSYHIGCYLGHNNKLVGTLILKPLDHKLVKMRQVAVDDEMQSRGIGKKMVIFSENFLKEKGYNKIELNARSSACPFYDKLSYHTEGDMFLEVGLEHYFMWKDL